MESFDKVLDKQKKEIETNSKILETQKAKERALSVSLNSHQLLLEESAKTKAELLKAIDDTKLVLLDLKKELLAVQDLIDAEKKTYDDLKAQNNDIVGKTATFESRIKEYEDHISTLKQDYLVQSEKAQADLSAMQKAFETQKVKYESKITALEADITDLEARKATAIKEVFSIDQQIKELTPTLISLKTDAGNLAKDNADQATTLESVKIEIDGLKQNLKDLTATEKDKKEQIATLELEVTKLAEDKVKAQSEVDALVRDKINFVTQQKALIQKEENIRKIYEEAGIVFPQ